MPGESLPSYSRPNCCSGPLPDHGDQRKHRNKLVQIGARSFQESFSLFAECAICQQFGKVSTANRLQQFLVIWGEPLLGGAAVERA